MSKPLYKVEIKKQMTTNIIPTPPQYIVKFSIGGKTFDLDPMLTDTKEQAEQLRDELRNALGYVARNSHMF